MVWRQYRLFEMDIELMFMGIRILISLSLAFKHAFFSLSLPQV